MSAEDPKDLRLAKRGDSAAAVRVIKAHNPLIVAWCKAAWERSGRRVELDDLRQEANMAALKAIQGFKPRLGYQFNTLLKRCILNALKDYLSLRREVRLPVLEDDESMDDFAAPELVGAAMTDEKTAELMAAVESLTPSERQVVELKFGLTGGGFRGDEQLAEAAGVPVRDVQYYASRAVSKLREHLAKVREVAE